ncbi:hypothetical protein Bca101_032373 [Brassica carinata]
MEKLMLSKYQSFFYYMEQNGWNRDNGLGDDELLTCSRTRGVPKMFAEMHMPKEETVFKIHDPKQNKSWYVVSKIQSRFSRGWPGLVKDFGLKVGDVCTFELIKPTEMTLTVDSM